MNLGKIVKWVFIFFLVIPFLGIGSYGAFYYFQQSDIRQAQEQKNERVKEVTRMSEKFGPWTIGELEDGRWEKWYKKVVSAHGKSFPFEIDGSKDSEFQTNPINLVGAFSYHNGKEKAMNQDRTVEDMDHNLPFFFINKTDKKITFYIRTKRRSRY